MLMCLPNQPRSNRVVLNIKPDPFKLILIPNIAIKSLFLPKRHPSSPQHRISLLSRNPLKRLRQLWQRNLRSNQQMNMIRHHRKGMQLIMPMTVAL